MFIISFLFICLNLIFIYFIFRFWYFLKYIYSLFILLSFLINTSGKDQGYEK